MVRPSVLARDGVDPDGGGEPRDGDGGQALLPALSVVPWSPVRFSLRGPARPLYGPGCYWASQPILDPYGRVVGYTGRPVQVPPPPPAAYAGPPPAAPPPPVTLPPK
jgi:hypothetical protein